MRCRRRSRSRSPGCDGSRQCSRSRERGNSDNSRQRSRSRDRERRRSEHREDREHREHRHTRGRDPGMPSHTLLVCGLASNISEAMVRSSQAAAKSAGTPHSPAPLHCYPNSPCRAAKLAAARTRAAAVYALVRPDICRPGGTRRLEAPLLRSRGVPIRGGGGRCGGCLPTLERCASERRA